MSKKMIAAIAAAVMLSAGVASAASSTTGMEKCMPTGKLVVKEHKSDCKADSHDCAGQNGKNDAKSWIFVPKGMCTKVHDAGKTGDMKGLPQDVQDKLDMMMPATGAATTGGAAAGGATTGGAAAGSTGGNTGTTTGN